MKYFYEIIVNGYEQNTLAKFDNKSWALQTLKDWKADGRLKPTDKAIIRTTIVIEDEINLWAD